MFGNAPRALWQRWAEPDSDGLIALATRCLLIRERSGRNVLLETGIGVFFQPELRERYGVTEDRHVLVDGLADLGLAPDDIDVIVLSHLHFDHAGGLLAPWQDGKPLALAFPSATVVVSREAWQRACHPHVRDRASFIEGLTELLASTGRLEIVDHSESSTLGPDYRMHFSDGHTPGLMLTEVSDVAGPIVYAADLVPGTAWVHVPITMGYDRFPELLVDEKAALLEDLCSRGGRLLFTHDAAIAAARIGRDPRGRFMCDEVWEAL